MLAVTSALEGVKSAINYLCLPHWFLIISVAALAVFLVGYRWFTKPSVAGPLAAVAALAFFASCLDSNFAKIVTKADNVPIVMLLFVVSFFLWLAFRQAAVNDGKIERGEPLTEAGADDKVLVWPDLVYIEFIALILFTAFLIVWAIVLPAPLEQPADPNVAPNPAKAPWYFLGLQEMLVYFDPWLAGVVFPGLIVVGLIAIPYIDKNPRGNGYYTFKDRKFAISTFLFGFVILWIVLIIMGTILRGPGWNFFGPFQYWDHTKVEALTNVNMSEMFGFTPQRVWYIRETPGMIFILVYFVGLPVAGWYWLKDLAKRYGPLRYYVATHFVLMMMFLPVKMYFRWVLNMKYIIAFPEVGINL